MTVYTTKMQHIDIEGAKSQIQGKTFTEYKNFRISILDYSLGYDSFLGLEFVAILMRIPLGLHT